MILPTYFPSSLLQGRFFLSLNLKQHKLFLIILDIAIIFMNFTIETFLMNVICNEGEGEGSKVGRGLRNISTRCEIKYYTTTDDRIFFALR